MAYIETGEGEGKWLDYEERAKYLAELHEEKRLLTKLLTEGLADDRDLIRLEDVLDELERVERIHRGEHDILYFAITYFSEGGNPGNDDNLIPEGVTYENTAQFHKDLCALLDDVATGKQKKNIAHSCPRGSAKTAYLSNIFLCHQVVYRHRKYIVLVSETTDVAGTFLSWTRYQLKLNEKLRRDFGEILHVKPSMNESDNKYEFITLSGTKVESKGLQVQMRGLRYGSTRPDLFVLDDLESKDSTNTKELIEKSKRWFVEEMLPALSRSGICVYLGTILCYDSLLHYVIKDRKDFESRKFAAVKAFSEREDLWEEWRKIYRSDVEDADKRALEFFESNEEEMLRGTELLWPEFWTYYDFMVIREENGIKAFNQEYQNNPTDEERQIFKPEYFHYFDDEDITDKNFKFFAGIDMAMGRTDKSDYTVITTIAKNMDTGVCYVMDAFIERCHPDILINKATELTMRYQYESIGIEAQFGQEFVADKLSERLKEHGYPSHTRMRYIKQRTRKELRIESMLPDIQNGKIRFKKTLPSIFMEQFYFYPMGHDDAPDSCEMSFSTARGGSATIRNTAKRMR